MSDYIRWRKQAQHLIDETDKIKSRLQELTRLARDTDPALHYDLAAAELEQAIAGLTDILKREEEKD